jgi:NodT family efflux transporter outer membrane factor (OMF) lipoprotein
MDMPDPIIIEHREEAAVKCRANVRRRALTCALIAAVIAGCTLGPDFSRPEAPQSAYQVPPETIGSQTLQYGAEVAADWYTLFGSQAVDHLVKEALRANPDLEAARHSLRAAQYALEAVAGTALPQVQVATKAARTKVNGSLLYEPNNAFEITANQFSIGPALAYDLDVFGRLRRTIEAQAAQTSSVRRKTLNVYITLVDQVVTAAFGYAATDEEIEVTQHLVADLQSQYDLTRLLEEAGRTVRSETLQAQAQLETTRATLPALEKQRDVYRNSLSQLMGQAPPAAAVPRITLRDFTLPARLPVSLPTNLVRQRPDILEAEDVLHEASAAIGIAEAARFPSFNLSGEFAQQSIKTADLFNQPSSIWSAGIDIAAPVFAGGTLRAREKEARERFIQAQSQYRSTVLGAFVEVQNTLEALQHDADDYTAHNQALAAASANRDLARQQFEQGKVNELVVLTAEQQYQNAALGAVQANVQRFADTARLFHALGGGWWKVTDPDVASAAGGTTRGDTQ